MNIFQKTFVLNLHFRDTAALMLCLDCLLFSKLEQWDNSLHLFPNHNGNFIPFKTYQIEILMNITIHVDRLQNMLYSILNICIFYYYICQLLVLTQTLITGSWLVRSYFFWTPISENLRYNGFLKKPWVLLPQRTFSFWKYTNSFNNRIKF